MLEFFQKKLMIHVILVVVGLILSFMLFFKPVTQGKTLKGDDSIAGLGMTKEINDFEEETGEKSMWTNAMFGGMPTFMIRGDQSSNIFHYLTVALRLGLPYTTVAIIFSYFLFLYLFLLVLKVKPLEAFFGALMFALSSYNVVIISAGHVTKAYAIAYIPLILSGLVLCFRSKYAWGALITCIGFGVQICSNHLQITYYTVVLMGVFILSWLIYAIVKKELSSWFKATVVTALACVFGVLPNLSHLWTTYEYQKETMRGGSELTSPDKKATVSNGLERDYAFSWSEGKSETFTLLIPHFMGGASYEKVDKNSEVYKLLDEKLTEKGAPAEYLDNLTQNVPTYRGDQSSTAGPIYFGCVLVFLAFFGFLIIQGPIRWWLIAGTVVSVLLSWGQNFPSLNYFLFDHVPFYNKFRSVSMWLSIASLTAAISAVLALHEFFNAESEAAKAKMKKMLFIAFGVVGGICLYFGVVGVNDYSTESDIANLQKVYPQELIKQLDVSYEDLQQSLVIDRKAMLKGDAMMSFFFIALAFGALFFYLTKKIKAEFIVIGICVISLFDIYKVDKVFFPEEKFEKAKRKEMTFDPSPVDQQILQDKSLDYRVLNMAANTFNDAMTSYFHKSVGGYHAAKLRRYQDLIERNIYPEMQSVFAGNPDSALKKTQVLNMLNTKYLIIPLQKDQQMKLDNPNALGNAWFIQDFKVVKTADEEINALGKDFNAAKIAVISQDFYNKISLKKPGVNDGKIKLTSYKPNELKYSSTSAKAGFAVFSEIYYPGGWKVSVDGNEAELLRVNYVLRGLVIPAGNHEITFVFAPDSFEVGTKVSGIASIILLIAIIGLLAYSYYSNKKQAV